MVQAVTRCSSLTAQRLSARRTRSSTTMNPAIFAALLLTSSSCPMRTAIGKRALEEEELDGRKHSNVPSGEMRFEAA